MAEMTEYLFFDTETTGFPSKKFPLDHPNQPHLVQLAATLCSDANTVLGSLNFIIIPDGFQIPIKTSEIHGITDEIANDFGISLTLALETFREFSLRADYVVAHNLDFDKQIMNIEFERCHKQLHWGLRCSKGLCTMKASVDACKIPNEYGKYKWPTLMEAYQVLVDPDGFENAHNAMADVEACLKVFFALKDGGYIKV